MVWVNSVFYLLKVDYRRSDGTGNDNRHTLCKLRDA